MNDASQRPSNDIELQHTATSGTTGTDVVDLRGSPSGTSTNEKLDNIGELEKFEQEVERGWERFARRMKGEGKTIPNWTKSIRNVVTCSRATPPSTCLAACNVLM